MLLRVGAIGVAMVAVACSRGSTEKSTSSVKPGPTPSATAKESPPLQPLPGNKPEQGKSWTFQDEKPGAAPRDFTTPTGKWLLAPDPTSKGGGTIVAQTAQNPNHVFNVALVKGSRFGDGDISVRLKAVSGKLDQGGGVVWRATDAQNYYIARFNPLEANYRLYFVKKGRRKQIASAKVELDSEAWHTLRVTMKGDHILCYLNGDKHLDAHDTTFTEPGSVGLWTKADAVTNFDDLSVRGFDGTGD